MSGLVTRRSALTGSAVAALGLAAGITPSVAVPARSTNDQRLVALADAFDALRQREHDAWGALYEDDFDDGPEIKACRKLTADLKGAGEALADIPARTSDGLAAKATAMLGLVGRHLDTQAALSEHEALVVSILRDAARLGLGDLS